MGLFESKCRYCGSKDHASEDCPHGILESKCRYCGSTEHSSENCPHGIFESKCRYCGSTDHSSENCPHGILESKCRYCGSTNHASEDCPHGIFESKCRYCGSTNHSSEDCPHGLLGSSSSSRTTTTTQTSSSSSSESGCATIIAWLVGIGIVVFVVVWLAVNVVLPVAMLNSALALAVLAFVFKKYKTLFAFLALVGGGYMLLDITNGWLSVNFVEKVVKNPDWISAFVYINAAALGLCAWLLLQPIWLKTEQMEPTEKRKSLLFKGALILLVAIATAAAPIIYYSVQNPFIQKVSYKQKSSQSQSETQNYETENENSKTQSTMIENQFIVDTYLGTIGDKNFKLFIEQVDGENVEGYNETGSNRRPVKGRIVNKWTEPTGLGANYTIFKLILTEPGDDKWDGEFNIDLWISDQGRHGKGSWKSFNGKLERLIIIKDRLNE